MSGFLVVVEAGGVAVGVDGGEVPAGLRGELLDALQGLFPDRLEVDESRLFWRLALAGRHAARDDRPDPLLDGDVDVVDAVAGDVDDVPAHHRVGGHREKHGRHLAVVDGPLDRVGRRRGDKRQRVRPLDGELDEFDLLETLGVVGQQEAGHLVETGVDRPDAGDLRHHAVEDALEFVALAHLGDQAHEKDQPQKREHSQHLQHPLVDAPSDPEGVVHERHDRAYRLEDEVHDEYEDHHRHHQRHRQREARDENAADPPAEHARDVLALLWLRRREQHHTSDRLSDCENLTARSA